MKNRTLVLSLLAGAMLAVLPAFAQPAPSSVSGPSLPKFPTPPPAVIAKAVCGFTVCSIPALPCAAPNITSTNGVKRESFR